MKMCLPKRLQRLGCGIFYQKGSFQQQEQNHSWKNEFEFDLLAERTRDVLTDVSRDRERLLTPLGENLPDPSSLKGWISDCAQFPSFTEKEMYNCFVLNKNTYDHAAVSVKKQLGKAQVFYDDGHIQQVQYHKVSDSNSHSFIRCQCLPSFPGSSASKKPAYNSWICISKDTSHVHSAKCDCVAGQGEACNHIAALMIGWLKNVKCEAGTKEQVQVDRMFRDNIDLQSIDCIRFFQDYFDHLHLTSEECVKLFDITLGQTSNDMWFEARFGRLTASRFGNIARRKVTTPPDNLLKVLLGYVVQYQGRSVCHGIQYEQRARHSYLLVIRDAHPPLAVKDCGLCVNPAYRYIGASPDGFCVCEHCRISEGLLEIKCPFKFRDSTPQEAACSENKWVLLEGSGVTL